MNKYSDLSCDDLNRLTAERLGLEKDVRKGTVKDYCNNWSYAGPLLHQYDISVQMRGAMKLPALASNGNFYVVKRNPCRAIVECFPLTTEGQPMSNPSVSQLNQIGVLLA